MGFPISKSLLISAARAIILKHEPDLVTLCPELYGKSHFILDKSWSSLALVHCISDISPSTISPCSPCYSHFNQPTVLQIHRACSCFGLWTGFSLCWRLLPPISTWLPPASLESAQFSFLMRPSLTTLFKLCFSSHSFSFNHNAYDLFSALRSPTLDQLLEWKFIKVGISIIDAASQVPKTTVSEMHQALNKSLLNNTLMETCMWVLNCIFSLLLLLFPCFVLYFG